MKTTLVTVALTNTSTGALPGDVSIVTTPATGRIRLCADKLAPISKTAISNSLDLILAGTDFDGSRSGCIVQPVNRPGHNRCDCLRAARCRWYGCQNRGS